MAGGSWLTSGEIIDKNTIKQQDSLSCGVACGEMLLRDKGIEDIDQKILSKRSGVPVDVATLAEVLNSFISRQAGEWQGRGFIYGSSYENTVDWLTERGIWAAELRELGKGIAHLVIVDGFDQLGRLKIRDPWEGTSYTMTKQEFVKYWTLRGIRWIQR